MGIDLATWRARIGLNYYHICCSPQTRWRGSGGQLYQHGVANWGVGEVMNDTPLVLKDCMTVVALPLILQYAACASKLSGSGKVHCHWWDTIPRARRAVDGGRTLLLRAIVVVIPLLLVMAGDVETNPGPEEPNLGVLLNELHPVYASWYKIGLQLGIPFTTLDSFKHNYSDTSDLMCEVLKHWFRTAVDPRPSWEAVVTALKSQAVNENYIAAQLESKYCALHMTEESKSPIKSKETEEPSLKALLHELYPVCARWYNIGLELDIPHTTLNGFKPMYSDQMREMLMYWLDSAVDPHPCWKTIVTALRSRLVNENYLADKLESKYCAPVQFMREDKTEENEGVRDQSTSSCNEVRSKRQSCSSKNSTASAAKPSDSISPTPTEEFQKPLCGEYQLSDKHSTNNFPLQNIDTRAHEAEAFETVQKRPKLDMDAKLDELHTAQDQVQYFKVKLGSLVDKACQEVIEKTEPSVFLSIVTYLSTPTQHRSSIEEKLMNIPPPVTIVRIWSVLDRHWDFLNYGLLKNIINAYGSLKLKKKMQKYVDELSTFKQHNQLSDFIKSSPCRDEGPPEEYLKLVVVKLNGSSQCKLEDVESAIAHKFFPPGSDVLLQKDTGVSFCICLTSPSIATQLQQNLTNIEAEFFEKHGIDAVTIDGQNICLTVVEKYGGYLKELYSSEQCSMGIGPLTPAEKLLPFNLARIEKDKLKVGIDYQFTIRYMRGDTDDVGTFGTVLYKKSPIKLEEVGKISRSQPKLILIEGAPGVGKTTFSWEFCKKWGRGEILQDHSLLLFLPLRDNNLKAAKTLLDLFINPELQQAVVQEIRRNQGQGVALWLDGWDELNSELRETASVFLDLVHGRLLPLATVFVTSRHWASENIRNNCRDRITQHIEILPSAEDQIAHYINKAEAEAQTSSFAAKFTDYLSSNPVIRAAMYTPVTAKMAAEVFTWSQHTESPLPTTMTELFTAFTLKTLVDHLSTQPVYHKQQLKLTTFSDLPADVCKQFQDLCELAYEGILNRQQFFSAADLPTGFVPLGLMQEVPQLYPEGRASSYHFTHLTLQEYLAAVHISQLPAHEQTRLLQEHLNSDYFKMTIKFLAGHTKLANMPPDVTKSLMESYETRLKFFHFLFEAKKILEINESLDLDEIVVRPHYSWTPLDYYVTGHVISHSNCPWRLYFRYSSIDDKSFELFCEGCAAPRGTECSGHIVNADFSENSITSKGIQSFVNIPSCIIEKMKKLELHHNKLDRSACDLLAKAVPSMSSLRKLWLSNNPIDSGGAVEVIKALCASEDCEVKQLLLWETEIGVPDCEALCELLESANCSLEELVINGNDLCKDSVASIITGLSHNSSLTHLNISKSHFDTANVVNLASVLKNHSKCTLTELRMRHTEIKSEGAVKLMAALSKNNTLKLLDLSHNPIGVHMEGVTAVVKLLEVGRDHSLTRLELRDCRISAQGAGELAAALCKNSTLKHLNLNFNHIGVKGASSLSQMLQQNKSLEVVKLRNESIGEKGVKQLISSLEHNQTLKKLHLPTSYKPENSDNRIEWC